MHTWAKKRKHNLRLLFSMATRNTTWGCAKKWVGNKFSTRKWMSFVAAPQAKNENILSCCTQNTTYHAFGPIFFFLPLKNFALGFSRSDLQQGDLCNDYRYVYRHDRPSSRSETVNFGDDRSRSIRFRLNVSVRGCCRDHSMYFSHLWVFLISVKPLATENTEKNRTRIL